MKDQTARKCEVCGSESVAEEDYCRSHYRGLQNLKKGYSDWSRAYVEVSLEEYFARLSRLSQTGQQVKEIAQYFQQHLEKWAKGQK